MCSCAPDPQLSRFFVDIISGTFLTCICCFTFSSLSLSDVEEKCKQAAALKLPLSRLEVNTEEARMLFQVSSN